MKIRIYLSGPITGLSEEEYTRRFARAEHHYRTAGYEVVNPVTIGKELQKKNPHPSYGDYMKADLEALATCTHIALLEGWENSRGAQSEKREALKLGLEIMQYKEIGGKKMIFPKELKIEAAEAYRQNILVPGFEHVNRNDWIDAWCCGVTYQIKKQQEDGWHDLRKNPEDLPKDNKDVLVYSGEQWRMCVGRYYPKYKSWEAGCDTIAWMEIPEPPKQEDNGNECHDCVAFDAMPRAPRCGSCDNGSSSKAREEK